MTTSVTIDACCANNNEVKIVITEDNADTEVTTLQDGESVEKYVYDSRVITIQEVEKT